MDFSKQIQKAQEALAKRNYDFAIDLFGQLLEIEPDLAEARAGLRVALKRKAEKEPGNRLLRAMGGAVPLGKARTLAKLGKHDACAKSLEEYLRVNPLDEEANLMLGIALENAGHLRSARAVYEFLAEIAPRNPEGWKRAGSMMRRTNDHLKALECYEKALSIDPRDQDALKARKDLAAETALLRGNLDSAAHSRERMKDKPQAESLERARRMHLSDDELRTEIGRAEQRLADTPNEVALLLDLAGLYERTKDLEAACELTERALSYRRGDYELVCKLGDLRAKALKKRIAKAGAAGDEELANRLEAELLELEIADARARVELRPADPGLHLQLGKRLLRTGALDEAVGELQRAVDDLRLRSEAQFLLAQAFHKKGFGDLASQQYQRALEGLPATHERAKEILYNLGAIAESEGRPGEARSWFVRIYEVDIGYKDVAKKMDSLKIS